MRRGISLFLAVIMAVTAFIVPMGSSYAEEQIPAEQTEANKAVPNNGALLTLEEDMVVIDEADFIYTADEIKPIVTVKNGETLVEGTDYTVSYSDNINVGTGQITVIGMGDYTGEITKTFAIIPASLEDADIELSTTDYVYDGSERKPEVTVMLGDFIVDSSNYDVTYKNNKFPGTAKVTITGKNNLSNSSLEKNFYISRITEYKVHQINQTSVKISWKYQKNVDGYILYQKKSGKWKQIKTIKKAVNNICTVNSLTPGVSYNFKVRAYKKSGLKTYYGVSKNTLWTNTRPKQVTLSSAKALPDLSVKATWKKINCSGYEVVLSRYSDFRTKTTYKTESYKTNYKTIKKLTDGKKYYIRVRAYKTVNGKNTYGSWSKAKSFVADDTGWLTKDGYKYYYVNGKYLTGYQKVNGKQYYFGSTGKWRGLSYKMWTKIKDKTSDTKYLIAVSRDNKRIVVYTGKKGEWKPQYYWKCTVGAKSTPTPTGSFKVPKYKTYQYAFGREHGYMAWYSTKIKGPYLFHSVLYQPGSKTVFYDGRLGMALSHGCIRVSLDHAKWIQDNIKPGTRVVIY